MSLIAELKRRNVFRVGVAYAIVGWLLVEVASVVLPTFKAPEWVLQVCTFLVIFGFPLALILAWAFELTPEGIKREAEVDRTESITHVTGRKLDFAIIGLLAVALIFVVVDNYVLDAEPEPVESVTERVPDGESVTREGSVAVLPFANRSANEDDVFFVDGMHDDILTHLAKIRSLKVISRTSVMEYRNTTKNLKTIGHELGATTILEGGVQRAGNHVRINVQLIDARTDEHLWAEVYDRQLTAANIFAIQTEIATAIADALRATLSPAEERRLATVPTDNLDAYEAYLLGRQRLVDRRSDAYAVAVDHFQEAIDLDPAFALAYVGLTEAYILQTFYTGVPREETLEKARVAAEQALSLNPQLGEAYHALAAVKQDTYDYAGAEEGFKRALELNPNHAQAYHWYGWMLRENLGRPEEALELHKRGVELDPLSGPMLTNVADDLLALGRFEEAAKWIELSFERAPACVENHDALGRESWSISGRLDEAVVHYTKGVSIDPGGIFSFRNLGLVYLDLGDSVAAGRWIRRSLELGPDALDSNDAMRLLQLQLGNETAAAEYARKAMASSLDFPRFAGPLEFLRDRELRAGRGLEARALYEKRYPELMSLEDPRVERRNFQAAISLAMIALRTEQPEYANLLLDRSLEILQVVPRLGPFGHKIADVKIQVLRGELEDALSTLRLAIDDGWRDFWWYYLEHDLSLEPLRDKPEYQAMVAEIEADMAAQLARVREMERNGELEPIPEVAEE